MGTVELFFVGILRFSLIAFVLLGTCLGAVRLMKQPLERIRLIQISLVVLLATAVLSLADVVPRVDLALLPAVESSETIPDPVETTGAVGVQGRTNALEPTHPSFGTNEFAATEVSDDFTAVNPTSATSGAATRSAEAPNEFTFLRWLRSAFTIAFLAVSFVNLVYLVIGFVATRRLVATATPLSDDAIARVARIVRGFPAPRHVNFVSSDSINVAMVVGIWRPTVLLPEPLTRAEADQLELKHTVAHEWGHIVLHDLVTWQLASLCQAFLWIQPYYWMLRRELRVAQDQLSDQFATEQTHEHTTYATTLLELSRTRQRVLLGALTMAGGKSNLYRRIEMLMNEKFRMVQVTRKSIMVAFAVLFVAAGGLLASLQLTHAASTTVPAPVRQPHEGDAKNVAANDEGDNKSAEHSGVVVDADTGKPIAGVTVTVTRMQSHDWRELAITKSVTDENGRYSFTIPPDQLSQRSLYIMFDIDHPNYARRHCGSYGYGMVVKNLENGEQPWFSKLKMVRGETIVGRLVDENQRPIAGAQIRCNSASKSGNDRVRSSSIDRVSDKDGRFELVATYDGMTKLSFVPTDHCMKHIDLGEKRGDIGDISLTTGLPIHGVVKDAKGNPMNGLWVNITPDEERNEASYEMKRSAKTDREGKFQSRPLMPGKYLVQVETKATGALEKLKYANFHNTPPPAMFVNRSINITKDSIRKPLVLQAVPHVLITVQHFTPKGDHSSGHSPSITGSFDGHQTRIREGRRTGKGAFKLMAPHGLEGAELQFFTNEHSGLMVQFEGGKLTPRKSHRFERLEEDIDNVRVVRHPAGILKLNLVDESGKHLKDGRIFAMYELEEDPSQETMMSAQIGWNREDGLFRLSSLVPGVPVSVRFSASGVRTQTRKFKMKEGERRTVTIKLKNEKDEAPASSQ